MSYRIAKLVSDYVSPGVFVNRLELGDSGFGGPVDLRFIGEPGWIENAHSVFLGVNGRDAYYPTNTGGLITTSDTGDLVFFDPSNDVGRTLSQLYAGGAAGLWEVDGSYSQLITARPIDMQGDEIIKILDLKGSLGANIGIHGSNATHLAWIEFLHWDHATEVLSLNDEVTGSKTLAELADDGMPSSPAQGNVIYYSGSDWVKLAPGTNGHFLQTQGAAANPIWAAISGTGLWELSGSYSQLITARDIDMQGYEIIKIADLKGSLNADFSLYGSNAADTDWIEFLKWDHATERLGLVNLSDPASARDAANKQWVDAHNWAATDITSGTLPVSRGGTGVTGDTYDADKVDGWHVMKLLGTAQTIPNGSGYCWYFTIASGTSMGVVPGINMVVDTGWYSGLTTYVWEDLFGTNGIKIVVWNASGASRDVMVEAIVIYY